MCARTAGRPAARFKGVMHIKPVQAISYDYGLKHSQKSESDIVNINDSKEGLFLAISTTCELGNDLVLEVSFEYTNGFRYLDEGDLIYYWQSGIFDSAHHIYQITSGGWSNGEALEKGVLSIGSATNSKEWFVVTSNGCINVLSNTVPQVRVKNA